MKSFKQYCEEIYGGKTSITGEIPNRTMTTTFPTAPAAKDPAFTPVVRDVLAKIRDIKTTLDSVHSGSDKMAIPDLAPEILPLIQQIEEKILHHGRSRGYSSFES